jgi:hypothetical protein
MTASVDAQLIADVLVNLFGAFGALVVAYDMRRSDPHGPVTSRALFALHLVAALFLVRSLAWITGSALIAGVVGILPAATPLAALLVAEGLLRRHAPRAVKLAILAGVAGVAVVWIVPGVPAVFRSSFELPIVVGGFISVGVVLWRRDSASLTVGENAVIRRVVIAGALLVPLIITDFRSHVPNIPVRFGAVGALVLLFFAFGPGRSTNGERVVSLVIFLAIAGVFAFGTLTTGHGEDAAQAIRATAVGLSGLLCAALFSEALGARSERAKAADPLLAAQTSEQFVAALREHRLIGDARVLEEREVAPLRHPAFDALVAATPVLKRADAPWGRPKQDDAVERASSLFMTYDATHVMRLSCEPLRLAVFALPQIAADARVESEIAAAQRIGELIFTRGTPRAAPRGAPS